MRFTTFPLPAIVEKVDTPQHQNQTQRCNTNTEALRNQIQGSSNFSEYVTQNGQNEQTISTACESVINEQSFLDSEIVEKREKEFGSSEI